MYAWKYKSFNVGILLQLNRYSIRYVFVQAAKQKVPIQQKKINK